MGLRILVSRKARSSLSRGKPSGWYSTVESMQKLQV
jgi:hypothetical protein